MGLFKADLYRFFTLGFAIGAAFVVATMEGDLAADIAHGVVPVAEAQTAQ